MAMQGDLALHTTPAEATPPPVVGPRMEDTGRLGPRVPANPDVGDALTAAHRKVAAADARLADAHDEAQSIIQDALEQAALVAARAERAAEDLLAAAGVEADTRVADSHTSARVVREQAEAIVATAREYSREQREQLTVELVRLRREHDGALEAERTSVAERLAADQVDVAGQAHAELEAARFESARLIDAASRTVEDARVDAETIRSRAQAQAVELRNESRADATRELAASAEQTAWTQRTMAGLLAAAETDAQRITRRAHHDAEAVLRRSRRRVGAILAATRARLQAVGAAAEQERERLIRQAGQTSAQADADAGRLRAAARAEADRLLREADEGAQARSERGERRLSEAEAGARTLRERAADDLDRSQREMSDLRRSAKEAAGRDVAEARAEADELRAQARRILADARAEVAVLTAHRDAIARELGELSGVIEALAVAGRAVPAAEPATREKRVDQSSQDLPPVHLEKMMRDRNDRSDT